MRTKLQAIEGVRAEFRATFSRFGIKSAYKGPPIKTILLTDITDRHGNPICDHIWFTLSKGFESLNLSPGDRIAFDARSKPYTKGYKGHRDDFDLPPVETDYRLSHPNKVRRLTQSTETLPLFSTLASTDTPCQSPPHPTPDARA